MILHILSNMKMKTDLKVSMALIIMIYVFSISAIIVVFLRNMSLGWIILPVAWLLLALFYSCDLHKKIREDKS